MITISLLAGSPAGLHVLAALQLPVATEVRVVAFASCCIKINARVTSIIVLKRNEDKTSKEEVVFIINAPIFCPKDYF
jgi:hypothetical protein